MYTYALVCVCVHKHIYIGLKPHVPLYFRLMSHHAEGYVSPHYLCDLLQEHIVGYQPNTPSKLDMICYISIGEDAVENQHSGLEQNRNILYKFLSEHADSSE